MEPLFFKAENVIVVGVETKSRVPSMEPLFFKAENFHFNLSPALRNNPSMEPLFFKAENATWLAADWKEASSFNGAAFFQSGKWGVCFDSFGLVMTPSMEPLFFKAENKQKVPTFFFATPGPSMEPLFFKAENALPGGFDFVTLPTPSMEPLFFKAENISAKRGNCIDSCLQWSRFFSKRKIN